MGSELPLGVRVRVTTRVGDGVWVMVTVSHIGKAAIRIRARVTVRESGQG